MPCNATCAVTSARRSHVGTRSRLFGLGHPRAWRATTGPLGHTQALPRPHAMPCSHQQAAGLLVGAEDGRRAGHLDNLELAALGVCTGGAASTAAGSAHSTSCSGGKPRILEPRTALPTRGMPRLDGLKSRLTNAPVVLLSRSYASMLISYCGREGSRAQQVSHRRCNSGAG